MAMREVVWPDVAVQPRLTAPQSERYVRSYLIMRVTVGALGIALPVLLVLGEPLLFDGQPFPRGSLSAYYYSGVRELFVGTLCAIGVFLVTYKVAERSRENRLSIYAGVAVILVALFPTGRPGPGVSVTPLQLVLGETTVERVHFTAAAVFIASLAVISFYFSRPGPKTGERPPSFWSKYHRVCAGFIVAALLLAAVTGFTGRPDKGLLIAEAVAVWAFGASWLMKGLEIDVLLGRRKDRATKLSGVSPEPAQPLDHPRKLADGNAIPLLGLGVWQVPNGPETENAVRWALELGYRHIDTAQAYGNEESVGRAIQASGIPREEIFITTKFNPRSKDPVATAEESLRRLGIDQVDLYIVHSPHRGPTWAWPGMEDARERGYARSIGVSNFSVSDLDELLAVAETPPVLNQVQFSAVKYRRQLLDACEERNVVLEAYSPLGTGKYLSDRRIGEIAERVGRTPAQVLLRWCVERNVPVIPKSTHRERIAENAGILDFQLSDEDMGALDALDDTGGTARALERPWW